MTAEQDMEWWAALTGQEIDRNTAGDPPYDAERVARLIQWMFAEPRRRVLDFGCGTGRLTAEMVKLMPKTEFIGVDSSPQILQRARERLPKIMFLGELYPKLRFDGAYSVTVLQHLDDETAAATIAAVGKALTPDTPFVCQFDYGEPDGEHAGPHNYPRLTQPIGEWMKAAWFTDVSFWNDPTFPEWRWAYGLKR